MNLKRIEDIVNAVLYEGYILYPYRPSSVKNRQRWSFGGIYPSDYSAVREGNESGHAQTQCLLQGDRNAAVTARVRFLHLIARQVGELSAPMDALPARPSFKQVDSLEVDGHRFYAWQEAMEREVVASVPSVEALLAGPTKIPFAFAGRRELEPLRAASGSIVGVLVRTQMAIAGEVELAADRILDHVFRITVRIRNLTPFETENEVDRDTALLHAFASTHTILGVSDGDFISLLDPPARLHEAAAACNNIGAYPVLVGDEGERDALLASPIILYDYPQIAPESPGDLFDGTEIDEILTLRILAMTDEEKREMAAVDPRARALLERTEALAPAQLQQLHGALRSPRPAGADQSQAPWDAFDAKPKLAFLRVGGVDLKVGDKVRLHPKGRTDIMDLALAGKSAVIEAIECDFEDRVHVAVTLNDDPGREFGIQRMPGHRFFFSPAELEALSGRPT